MSTLTEAAAACCACLRVHWTETKHEDGSTSGRWLCTQCGNEFESRTVASWADGGGGPGECAAPSEHRCKAEGCRRRLAPWCAEHRDDVVMRADYEALRADLETAAAVTSQLQAELEAERHLGEVSQAEYSTAITRAAETIKKLDVALERVARCLITPNPGIKDTIWLDPAPKALSPTLYEFICGVLGREVKST